MNNLNFSTQNDFIFVDDGFSYGFFNFKFVKVKKNVFFFKNENLTIILVLNKYFYLV